MRPLRMNLLHIPLNNKYGLGKGLVAVVDDCDAELVSGFNWYVRFHHGQRYAVTNILRPDGRKALRSMHQMILGYSIIDHKDGDGLNNKRNNLRPCTNQQNQANCTVSRTKKIPLKGVYKVKCGKFEAKIMVNRKSIWLGSYSNPSDAARVYDEAAVRFFGEFARTNSMMGLI